MEDLQKKISELGMLWGLFSKFHFEHLIEEKYFINKIFIWFIDFINSLINTTQILGINWL